MVGKVASGRERENETISSVSTLFSIGGNGSSAGANGSAWWR